MSMEVDDTAESMAITKAAMEGRVEEISPHMKSLDVVANQIAGMVMDFGEVGTDKILRILQRTYPVFERVRPLKDSENLIGSDFPEIHNHACDLVCHNIKRFHVRGNLFNSAFH